MGGDVVTGIDGRTVGDQTDMNLILNRKRPGDIVKVEFYRGKEKMEIAVTLGNANH